MIRMTIMAIGNMIIVAILLTVIMLSGCAIKPKVIVNENFLKEYSETIQRFNKYQGQNILGIKEYDELDQEGNRYRYTKSLEIHHKYIIAFPNKYVYSDIIIDISVDDKNIINDIRPRLKQYPPQLAY